MRRRPRNKRLTPMGALGIFCGIAGAFVGVSMARAQDMAITNAIVVIGDGSEPIRGGTVVVRSGKVVAAGANVAVPVERVRTLAAKRWRSCIDTSVKLGER